MQASHRTTGVSVRSAGPVERVVLGLLVALAVVHAASTSLRAPGAVLPWADLGVYLVLFLGLVGLCLRRAAREPSQRWAWRAVGLAMLLWALGAAYHGMVSLTDAPRMYPSPGDWLSLAAFPVGGVALILLLRALVPSFLPLMWLDGLTAALGMAALAYPLVLERLVDLADGSAAVMAASLSYPVGLLVLLVLLGGIAGMLQGFLCRMWLLLSGGLLACLIGSLAYAMSSSAGTYVQGAPTDSWWSLSAVLFAGAAVTLPAEERPRLRVGPWWAMVLLPGVFAFGSLVLLAYGQAGELSQLASTLAIGSIGAAGVRAVVTYREVSRLAESRRQARTDDLTGLLNRRGFGHALQTALSHRTPHESVAVLLMDLDRFKEVNDALGHAVGDELLRLVGPRVSGCLRERDRLARLGGDEFGIVLADETDARGAAVVAERIARELARPFDMPEISLHVGASIGIAVCPRHATDATTLLRQADVAMYDAKAHGGGYRPYDPQRDSHSRDRLETIEQLRAAITRDELVLHYQPKVELATGAVLGVEALVRWQHPDRGLLTPEQFLPLAEHTGLMRRLTEHVLEVALTQLRAWRDCGWELSVAVNVSASNLLDAAFAVQVPAMLQQHGLAPHLLTLEITEGTIMADPARAREVVQHLHDHGVLVAVDDYGTGYSSLAYLRHLAVRELKLDRAFVRDLCRDPRASAIVRSTVDLAHSLGLQMVAEGVEDAESACRLTGLGCDIAQGFHYSPPVSALALQRWLLDRRPAFPGAVPVAG